MATAAVFESDNSKNETAFEHKETWGVPLDVLQITIIAKNGLEKSVPALNRGFMEVKTYVHFRLPPNSFNNPEDNLSAEEEEWIDAMTFFVEDLRWILQLPYQRFWSQVVYDENFHQFLESYLFQAYRDYDVINLCIKDELATLLQDIHKLVFLVFLRMSTYKESKEHHIRPQAFSDLIYDCFLFDVPKIMDLCVLYGFQNQPLLSKMVENIFTYQPKYMMDLLEVSQSVLKAFSKVEERLFINLPESSNGCVKLEEKAECGLKKLTIESFTDVINYITDISGTLYAFLEIYPPASKLFFQNGAVNRISTFYEQVFPAMENEVKNLNQMAEYENIVEDIKRKIVLSKSFLIKLFRNILNVCGIESVLNSRFDEGTNSIKFPFAENFVEIFFAILSEKNFLHDYNVVYPFDTDLELFNEMGVHLDPDRLNYIFSSIHDCPEMFTENVSCSIQNGARPKQKVAKKDKNQNGAKSFQNIAAVLKPEHLERSQDNAEECEKEPKKSDGQIQKVLDLFPDLDKTFIERCLEYYCFNIENVIDALLSNSLPEPLEQLHQTLKRNVIPAGSLFENSPENSILSERRNIYDNDEFDVFSRNEIDMSKVHKGKKNKTPNQYQVLEKDDEFLKQLILNYGSEETEDPVESNLYEDEYDDTYDSAMVGLKETFIEDEPDDPNEQISEEKNEEAEHKRNTLDFCTNPEILRQKAEERRKLNAARKSGNKHSNVSSEHERQQKGVHKSQRGNHNRRKQADFKRSSGMFH